MGDPGPEIIESAPPAGPEASESTTDENEDDIQFVSEGPLRPVLEYIDLVSSDDEEPSTSHSDENFKHKDYIDHQKDKVALTLARLARHVEVEKQQKEEKNRAFREKLDFQHAHGLQELEFIQGHSETEAARQCVDQWLKMSGLKTINSGKKHSFQSGGRMGRCEKSILCPIMHCNKEFDNGHLLLGHLKRFDHSPCDPTITLRGPLANSFACVVCYEHFVSQQQYRDHLLTKVAAADGHSNGLPPQIIQCFACPSCFLLFSTKDACLKHMSAKNHFHQRFKLGDEKVTAHPVSFPSFAKKLLVSLCKDVPFQVKCVACHQTLRSHMELTAHFRVRCRNAGPVAIAEKSIAQVAEEFIVRGYCSNCNQVFVDETNIQSHKNSGHKVTVVNSVQESVLLYCHISAGSKPPCDLHLFNQPKFSSLKRVMSIKESSAVDCVIPKKKPNLGGESHGGIACVQSQSSAVTAWCCECSQRFPSEEAVERHVFSANTMCYKCVVCGKVCEDSGVMRLHMSRFHGGAHLNNFLFWCRTCKKELIKKDAIMGHITEFHNGHRYFYEIDEVEEKALPSSSAVSHLDADKPPSPITVVDHCLTTSPPRGRWQCRICEDMFDSQECVKQHCMSLSSHQFHRYSCAHCRKTFHKVETLYRHCQDEHDNEIKMKYFCGLCDLIFNREEAFLSHYKDHHSIDYVFVSEKTETSIKTEDDFKIIETSNLLSCGCHESYICKVNRKEDYDRCLQIMLDKGKLWFRCSSCSATAQNLADINTHVHQAHKRDTNDEDQQYVIKCGTCTKAFQNTESAQQHFHRKHATFQKPAVAPVGSDRGSTCTFAASASHAEKKLKPANYQKLTDVEKGAEHDTSCQSIGGNTNWKPPLSCKVYNYLNRIGCFFLHPRCSKRKDAADFAICMHAGRLDEQLPKQIPFTILSGDQGFLELENQFKKTQRPAHILNPHHLEGDMMCALLNSISDTTKECDSDDSTGVKGTAVEELRSTEDVELEEAIRRSLEEM
uniref:E3 SUMO-protein ligase ZNF451 isoform X2 n=1 Tax=Myodes glareolus TaxID=447135 RepID=UPI002021E916|nr:E3 SUMO-protein ligase ZNF451 isoform X2 [Myodes glareolus]